MKTKAASIFNCNNLIDTIQNEEILRNFGTGIRFKLPWKNKEQNELEWQRVADMFRITNVVAK
jgi:hypothetical protein